MPSQKLPGRELPDWFFDPLSSSWVSRDSENICWVYTTRQANFKWLEPGLETGKYLSGNRFLFTSTKPNFQPPQNENWQDDVLICMHETHIGWFKVNCTSRLFRLHINACLWTWTVCWQARPSISNADLLSRSPGLSNCFEYIQNAEKAFKFTRCLFSLNYCSMFKNQISWQKSWNTLYWHFRITWKLTRYDYPSIQ